MEKLNKIEQNTKQIPAIYQLLASAKRKPKTSSNERSPVVVSTPGNQTKKPEDTQSEPIVDAIKELSKDLTSAVSKAKPVVSQSIDNSQDNRKTITNKTRVVKSAQPESPAKKPERGNDGRFQSKSKESSEQNEAVKRHTGLMGLLSKSLEVSKDIRESSSGEASDAAGTAIGGVYWGAITEITNAVGNAKDSSIYERIKNRKSKDSDSSKPVKKATDKRHKRAAIKADASTVDIKKTVEEVSEDQKSSVATDAKQHKETIEALDKNSKSSTSGLLGALGALSKKIPGVGKLAKLAGIGAAGAAAAKTIGGAKSSAVGVGSGKDAKNKKSKSAKLGKAGIIASAVAASVAAVKKITGSESKKEKLKPSTSSEKRSAEPKTKGPSKIKMGGPIGAILAAFGIASNEMDSTTSRKEKTANNGALAGRLGAGAIGAAIGTMIFPGVGTLIGGLAGDYFGGKAGEDLGRKAGEWFHSADLSSIKDSISANVSAMTDKFKASELGAMLMPRFETISGELSNAGKSISNLASSAMSNFNGFVDSLKQTDIAVAIQSGFNSFTSDLSNAKTTFTDWVAGLSAQSIGQSLSEATSRLKTSFDETVNDLKSASLGSVFESAKASINSVIDSTLNEIKNSSIGQSVSEASTRLSTAIDGTISELKNSAIGQTVTTLTGKLSSAIDTTVSEIKNSSIGQSITESTARLRSSFDETINQVKQSDIAQTISAASSRLSTSLDETIADLKSTTFGDIVNSATSRLSGAIDTVVTGIQEFDFSSSVNASMASLKTGFDNSVISLQAGISTTVNDLKNSKIGQLASEAITSLSTTVENTVTNIKESELGRIASETINRMSTGIDSVVSDIKSSEFGRLVSESVTRLEAGFNESVDSLKNSASNISTNLSETVASVSESVSTMFSSENLSKKIDSAFSFVGDLKEKALSKIEAFSLSGTIGNAAANANNSIKNATGVDVGAVGGAVNGIVMDTTKYLAKTIFGSSKGKAEAPINNSYVPPRVDKDSHEKNMVPSAETAKWLEIDRQERQRSEQNSSQGIIDNQKEASLETIKTERTALEARLQRASEAQEEATKARLEKEAEAKEAEALSKDGKQSRSNFFVTAFNQGLSAVKSGIQSVTNTVMGKPKPVNQSSLVKKDTSSSKQRSDLLLSHAVKSGITDKAELANFMGQSEHESQGFNRMTENMNYSASRLLKVFPGRNGMKTKADADRIVSGGQKSIANHVYGGAWGKRNLGNTEANDGWNFRARGFKHLTGRDNYSEASKATGYDLINNPDLAAQPEIAAKIATWYWESRVPEEDRKNVKSATKKINGGYNGLADRQRRARKWNGKLAGVDVNNLADKATAQPKNKAEVRPASPILASARIVQGSTLKRTVIPDNKPEKVQQVAQQNRPGVIPSLSPASEASGTQQIVNAINQLKVASAPQKAQPVKPDKKTPGLANDIPVDIDDAYWMRISGGARLQS